MKVTVIGPTSLTGFAIFPLIGEKVSGLATPQPEVTVKEPVLLRAPVRAVSAFTPVVQTAVPGARLGMVTDQDPPDPAAGKLATTEASAP